MDHFLQGMDSRDLHRIVIHNIYDNNAMEESNEAPYEDIHRSGNSSDSEECFEVVTSKQRMLHSIDPSQQLQYEPEKKRRRTTSSCWQYFDVVYNDNVKCGLCRHCGKTLRAANGTKGLLSHISSCEGLKYKEMVQDRKEPIPTRFSTNGSQETKPRRVRSHSSSPPVEIGFITQLRDLIADGATGKPN